MFVTSHLIVSVEEDGWQMGRALMCTFTILPPLSSHTYLVMGTDIAIIIAIAMTAIVLHRLTIASSSPTMTVPTPASMLGAVATLLPSCPLSTLMDAMLIVLHLHTFGMPGIRPDARHVIKGQTTESGPIAVLASHHISILMQDCWSQCRTA